MSHSFLRWILGSIAVALPVACGEPAERAQEESEQDAGKPKPRVDAGTPAACEQGETKACACETGKDMGMRACVGGRFSDACTGCFKTPVKESKCVEGHYSGRFTMAYTPGPAGI